MKSKSHDRLDAQLDAAVKTYVDAEPLNGLEDRILNRAALVCSGKRFKYGPLMAAGATLALSCLFVAGLRDKRIEPKMGAVAVAPVAPKPPIPVYQAAKTRPRMVRRLPKREVFPTPEPPSAEELALLHFVERYPKQAAQTFTGLQHQMNSPLDIEPLEIKPLAISESDN